MQSINIDSIKNKIRALLAKAESTEHEGERDLFLAKAHELLEKHQLDLFELDDEDPIGWFTCDTRYQAGPMAYKSQLHSMVAKFYGCRVVRQTQFFPTAKGGCIQGWYLDICGSESSRLTVEIMFPFIWDQVNKQAKWVAQESRGTINQSKAVREVAKALAVRINRMLNERRNEPPKPGTSTSLVVVNAIESAIKSKYTDLVTTRSKGTSTISLAREAAAGISLSRQVNTKNTLRLQ